GYAMTGYYLFWGKVGDYPSNCVDSSYFNFRVISLALGGESGDWYSSGAFGFEGDAPENMPSDYSLMDNYPNPFNATTNIEFTLPNETMTSVEVYNLKGQKVEILLNSILPVGAHSVSWDASKYSSGVYFYKLTTDDFTSTKRMTLLK
ncbi:MAG: T9SS type A sorting domain-containing protein, partial [candidate division Zixibacteria bacterium]|nr:T9SS type A sorting domain-containing protein [candidate division Zixibacteria bacterium]